MLKKYLSLKICFIASFLLATAIAVATFIENDLGTTFSWAYIYTRHWFELLIFIIIISLIYNIYRYKMYKIKKFYLLIFHLSFILMALGAFITRYYGFEGTLHIRNNTANDLLYLKDDYITVIYKNNNKLIEKRKRVFVKRVSQKKFDFSKEVFSKKLKIKYVSYNFNTKVKLVSSPNGKNIVSLIILKNNIPRDLVLKDGNLDGPVGLNTKSNISLFFKNKKLYLKSTFPIRVQNITTRKIIKHKKGSILAVQMDKLYLFGSSFIKFKDYKVKGNIRLVKNSNDAGERNIPSIVTDIKYNGVNRRIVLVKDRLKNININGKKFSLSWGKSYYKLPFILYLSKFVITKYPGSRSPSSFASYVKLKDGNKIIDYKIYLNHVLDHKGYRFFQSSYDKDGKGTILSVNHDPGKNTTYLGYFLLFLGIIINIFHPKSRINQLIRELKGLSTLVVLVLLSLIATPSLKAFGKVNLKQMDINKVNKYLNHNYPKSVANNFGRLIVQDVTGRMKPMDTYTLELKNKIIKNSGVKLDHNQIILSMMVEPKLWLNMPIFRVKSPEIKKILGIKKSQKYIIFKRAFDYMDNYKLTNRLDTANRKRLGLRNETDKEIIKLDEQINIFNMIINYQAFNIIPFTNGKNKWASIPEAKAYLNSLMNMGGGRSDQMQRELATGITMISEYLNTLALATKTGDYSKVNVKLAHLIKYQYKIGNPKIVPNPSKVKIEILSNRLNIFNYILYIYLITAIIIFIVTNINRQNRVTKNLYKVSIIAIYLTALVHLLALATRWYLAGNAPLSNSYESMLTIALVIAIIGLYFKRYAKIAISITTFCSAIVLFVADLNWLNPQITPLTPVLKSYWLLVHVSVITASYAFFIICAILGVLTLISFTWLHKENRYEQTKLNIKKYTCLNEILMILGLMFLIIGNFLGSIWANESWGRYWSWDPKESWTLISVIVYAIIVHLKYIKFKSKIYIFNVASIVAFYVIIMTFFGVNYYLSGMHSYGKGDSIPIPNSLIISMVIFAVLIVLSIRNADLMDKK